MPFDRSRYPADWEAIRARIRRGGDISRLQQTLGHGSSKVTLDYYATWDDRHLRDAHKDFSPHDNGGK